MATVVEGNQNSPNAEELKMKFKEEQTESIQNSHKEPNNNRVKHHKLKEEPREMKTAHFPDVKRKYTSMEERVKDLENGLTWIRKELGKMREQDKNLSKELVGLKRKVEAISELAEPDFEENSKSAQ